MLRYIMSWYFRVGISTGVAAMHFSAVWMHDQTLL